MERIGTNKVKSDICDCDEKEFSH